MKEQFRSWDPKGNININYKDGKGKVKAWTYPQIELLQKLIEITEEYQEQDIRLTGRQLYYQLVARKIIPNAIEIYKRISKFSTDARYGGYVDWKAIEDRGRVPERHAQWDDVPDLIESAVSQYRRHRWDDQDEYIELYCEKQALESVFKPMADKWHIYFGYNKGYSSASAMYDLAKRVKEQIVEMEKFVTILYFGDMDPSGLDMIRDIRERVIEFLTQGEDPLSILDINDEDYPLFLVEPVALNIEQVRQYNPPPDPAKRTDPRAQEYIKRWGNESWELDALNPTILRNLTENAILSHLDRKKYDEVVRKELEEIEKLRDFGNTFNDKDGEPNEK